ncbi:MAG: hypothetical protein OEO82_08910, partial [Gammaproteobacteria bacterium]|nr:hypothetical protein [Gammaproteobacteria bacterium]
QPNSQSKGTREGLLEALEAPSVMESNNLYRRQNDIRHDVSGIPCEAKIVKVRLHHDGRFSVRLDNGETWRETRETKMRVPEAGRLVEIFKDGPGGHRMRIKGNPRVAWVKRSD